MTTLHSCETFDAYEDLARTQVVLLRKTADGVESIRDKRLEEDCRATFAVDDSANKTYFVRWPKQHPDYRTGRSKFVEV